MSIAAASPRTLADTLPAPTVLPERIRGLVRDAALVVGGAVLIGLAAQVAIPLPFTPVPLTLQTLAVLLSVTALGSVRGLASTGLYLVAGAAGVPWFSDHGAGWHFASFGYILGFVFAAVVVGRLAERGADRRPVSTAGLMVLGNIVIYAVGVPVLMAFTGWGLGHALAAGVLPFLIGDAIKIVIAAAALPLAWKVVDRH